MDNLQNKKACYVESIYQRRIVRDAIAGSPAVKRANEFYLPIPTGFIVENLKPTATTGEPTPMVMTPRTSTQEIKKNEDSYEYAPWRHQNKAYESYLQTARFPEITAATLRGLLGVITQKDFDFELPSQLSYMEESADRSRRSLFEFFKECVSEVLQVGNVDIAVGVNEKTNELYLQIYNAEMRINWFAKDALALAVNYAMTGAKADEEDPFSSEEEEVNLVFKMDGDNAVYEKYVDGDLSGAQVTPSLQGSNFKQVPVFPIGSLRNDFEPQPAVLSGIAEIAYSIYRKDADLTHSEHTSCVPTFVITGAANDSKVPVVAGGVSALVLEHPQANAFYTTTDTSALEGVRKHKQELFEEALLYGASLLGPGKKSAESEETVKIRQESQGATLVSVVENVGKGIQNALEFCASVTNSDPNKVVFVPPTDFSSKALSAQFLSTVKDIWLNQGMATETFIRVLNAAGLHGEDWTVEDELSAIESEGPKTSSDIDADLGASDRKKDSDSPDRNEDEDDQ